LNAQQGQTEEDERTAFYKYEIEDKTIRVMSTTVHSLLEYGLIEKQNDNWIVDPEVLRIVDKFIELLKSKNLFEEYSSDLPL